MTRKQANKFIGKKVKITFKQDWINEAIDERISEDEEYEGILEHSICEGQEHLYRLKNTEGLKTNGACWSANSMKRIEELE